MIAGKSQYDERKGHFSKWLLLLWVWASISIFSFSIFSLVLAQDGYPQPTDLYVNDYANLLTPEDETNITALFSTLKHDTDIEAVVVTINSINDYGTSDETIESFATNIFNTWGIGDKQRNDGVLILVAVEDQKVRIEVGSGYGDTQNSNMQEVINEYILPHFRQDNYSQGIYQGAQAVVGILSGGNSPEPSPHVIDTIFGYEITSEQIVQLVKSQGFWYGIIIVSLVFVIYMLRRRRRRRYYIRGYGYYSDYGDGGRYSGGSTSFGGGDSSGGGASGDW